jgi:hypothetical protein
MHDRLRDEARLVASSQSRNPWPLAIVGPAIVWFAGVEVARAQQLLCYEYQKEGFGTAVAGGEDLDGDGKDEFLVGDPLAFSMGVQTGIVHVMGVGCAEHALLAGFTVGEEFGASITVLSDIDGDGLGDFVVGAPGSDAAGIESGRVSVFSGRSRALLYSVPGSAAGDRFGSCVARAGDVDGDGVEDWIAGAPSSDLAGPGCGRAMVVSGRGGAILLRFNGGTLRTNSASRLPEQAMSSRRALRRRRNHTPIPMARNRAARSVFGADGSVLYSIDGRLNDELGYAVAGLGDLVATGMPISRELPFRRFRRYRLR